MNKITQKLSGDLTAAEVLAYGVAAIRETLEEAGVFLGHRYESTPDDLKRICQLRLSADLPPGWLQKLAVSENWTLNELLQYANLQELAKETENRLWGEALLPRMIPLGKGAVIVEPWDPLYSHKNIEIDSVGLHKAVLPIGQSFSRIWHHQGIWRPVGN